MPNRYYRISPPPLRLSSREKIHSFPYLAWLWSSRTISVVLLGLVTGISCAPVFTPTTLQTFKESRDITSTTALERPRLALSPHSDGLGWTVRITQTVEETNRIRREEVWGGYTYERRLNLVTILGGGCSVVQISCSIPSFRSEHQTSPDGAHHGNTAWPPPDMTCLAAPIPELGSLMTSIPKFKLLHGYL